MIIGLTGIIGAGKSTVAEIFRHQYGTLVIDADKIGHELLEKDQDVSRDVYAAFGTNKRDALAKLVFEDSAKLMQLNEITHPAIREKVQELINMAKTEKIILIDAALLFTIGLNGLCQKIIFVKAGLDKIIERLAQRGLKEEEIMLRLKANEKVIQLEKECDFVIDNSGTKAELQNSVEKIFKRLN